MTKKSSSKRKWTAEEVQQWYRDTGAVTYVNPDDLNMLQCQQPGEARQPGVLFSYSRLSYNGREIGLTRL